MMYTKLLNKNNHCALIRFTPLGDLSGNGTKEVALLWRRYKYTQTYKYIPCDVLRLIANDPDIFS